MATVYVDADAYFDAVVYSANDTVTVRYGAEEYVRESNTTLPFQNTSTDSPIRITTKQRKLVLAAGGYVNCVAGDIGKTVVGATTGDTGTLIDYDNATRIWHVLRTDPTDDQFDNASENISITGGTGAGAMSAAADQYIIFKFNSTANSGIVPSGTAQLIIEGDWYYLGTGDGSASQTFAFYGAEACPWVQVETGAGTNLWTDCRCIYNTAFSTYGAGTILGNVFQHAPDAGTPIANITFGDGTNGMVVPNGARVRCPDIYITSAASYTATYTNRSRVYTASGARHNWNGALFSDRFYFTLAQCPYVYMDYVGAFTTCVIQETYDIDLFHLIIGKDRAVTNTTGGIYMVSCSGEIDFFNGEWYGPASNYTSGAIEAQYSSDLLITNSQFVCTQRTNQTARSLYLVYCSNITVNDCVFIGGAFALSSGANFWITDSQFSDTPSGAKSTAYVSYLFTIGVMDGFYIDGVSLVSGGSPPYDVLFSFSSACHNGIIQNVILNPDSHATYAFYQLRRSVNVTLANCDFSSGAFRTGNFSLQNTAKSMVVRNVLFSAASYGCSAPCGLRVEGVVSASPTESHTSEYDTPYQFIYTSNAKTSGYICLIFTPETDLSYFDLVSGDPDTSIYFNNSGRLYMKTIGDQCTFEIPYLIQGVDSFVNAAPTILHADFGTNVTQEYSIKSGAYGSSWSAWTAVTGANLAAESVDSVVGFYLKFRFTTATGGANVYASRYMLSVNTDAAFTFPVGYVDVVLSGIVIGSSYTVYDNTNARMLAQGVAAATSVTISAPYEFDDSDISITVRARKGNTSTYYKPWETSATYDENGAIIFVEQETDEITTSDLTAPISFDAVNKLVIVADSVTTVSCQQISNAIRDYETTEIATIAVFSTITGKDLVETGKYTGIVLKLVDDWRVQFEDRAGPAWVNCTVTGGDLIADNSYGDDPICSGAYVNTTRGMSTASALLSGSGSAPTVEEIDAQLSSTHGSNLWEKRHQYP